MFVLLFCSLISSVQTSNRYFFCFYFHYPHFRRRVFLVWLFECVCVLTSALAYFTYFSLQCEILSEFVHSTCVCGCVCACELVWRSMVIFIRYFMAFIEVVRHFRLKWFIELVWFLSQRLFYFICVCVFSFSSSSFIHSPGLFTICARDIWPLISRVFVCGFAVNSFLWFIFVLGIGFM